MLTIKIGEGDQTWHPILTGSSPSTGKPSGEKGMKGTPAKMATTPHVLEVVHSFSYPT